MAQETIPLHKEMPTSGRGEILEFDPQAGSSLSMVYVWDGIRYSTSGLGSPYWQSETWGANMEEVQSLARDSGGRFFRLYAVNDANEALVTYTSIINGGEVRYNSDYHQNFRHFYESKCVIVEDTAVVTYSFSPVRYILSVLLILCSVSLVVFILGVLAYGILAEWKSFANA
jgi:hypothetical protein